MTDCSLQNECFDAVSKLALFVEASPIAVITFDAELRFVGANAAAYELLGIAKKELISKQVSEIFAIDQQVLREYDHASYNSVEVLRIDGSVRWVDGQITLEKASGLYLLWCVDVTERQELRRELERQNRLESVGRMAGGIAHDFNNMLTAILSFADLQMQLPQVGNAALRYAVSIQAAAERAAEITKQLLAFCKGQDTAQALVDVNEVIRQSAVLVQRLIGERIVLELELAPSLPAVRADRTQLTQVLMNLAVNARDAMPGNGRLLFKTILGTGNAGERISIRVQDSGSGIPPETLPHIFDPFFTTKPPGKGTGLGLATVRNIVKQNHGEIVVTTEVGKGTSFEITLPLANEIEARSTPAQLRTN